jgi:hypothetical protein
MDAAQCLVATVGEFAELGAVVEALCQGRLDGLRNERRIAHLRAL